MLLLKMDNEPSPEIFLCGLVIFLAILGLTPSLAISENHVSEAHGVRVIVITTPFDKNQHNLLFGRVEKQDVLLKIDGRDYSGSDGSIPETEILSITIEITGTSYLLPRSSYGSLFNPHLGSRFINSIPQISFSKKKVLVSFSGGDGAGFYRVRWEIDTDKLTGTQYLEENPHPDHPKREKVKLIKSE